MNEVQAETTEIKAPAKRKYKKRRAKPAPKAEKPAKATGEFAGITANKCPNACTAQRCVISTIDICKHPYKSGDSGCGPITMKNRLLAKKLIKHQLIDAKE